MKKLLYKLLGLDELKKTLGLSILDLTKVEQQALLKEMFK